MISTLIYPPAIDKLSICLAIDDNQDKEDIEKNLWMILKSPGEGFFGAKKTGGYQINLRMHLPSTNASFTKHFILIQARPYNIHAPFMRFEWNPWKIGVEGLGYFKAMLETMIPYGYLQLRSDGKVTRLDIAVDILGTPIDELIIRAKRSRAYSLYMGADGHIETVYLGKPKSAQTVAYDRVKKLQKEGQKAPAFPITRIECRLKPNIPLHQIAALKNPLRRVVVIDLSKADLPACAAHLVWFRDSCRTRGIKNALRVLPTKERKTYEKAINAATVHWWDPEVIWSSWGDVVESSEL